MSENQTTKTLYELFISYYNEDQKWYESISKLLKQQNVDTKVKVKCKCMNDFMLGMQITESIAHYIDKSHITMVIVTERSIERNWLKHEFMKALEKSEEKQQLCVVLVLVDTDVASVQKDWHGHIHDDMVVKVTSSEDWKDSFSRSIIERIKVMKHMEPIQIALNLSVGLVWSHFFGYSKNVMPVLKEKIRTSQWYLGNETRFPLKEFNLIPKTATAVKSLSDIHESIVREGQVDIVAQRGSYKNRPYHPPVYSITDQNGQKYYFIAHIPNTLSMLSESQLEQQKKTGKHLQISPGERSLQVARFSILFNHLLNHPLNPTCNDMVELIEYDDKLPGKDIAQLLLDAVKRACPETLEAHSVQIDRNVRNLSLQTNPEYVTEDYANAVYIANLDEDDKTAEELESFLKTRDINVITFSDSPSRTIFENIKDATVRAKWFIFILSKAAVKEKMLTFECRMVLHKSVDQNEVRLIPLLTDDVQEGDLPGDLKAVLYLNKSNPDYKEAIASIIKGGSIKMEAKVSVKGVHTGMAWAYAINYLELIKVNISENETKKLSEMYTNAQIHHRLFLLIPKSCTTKQLGELHKDDGGQPLDPDRFKLLPDEVKLEKILNGIQRDYPLLPYMVIDDNKKEHIVFAEFVNPVKCLQEMMETDMRALSGMTTDVFDDEVNKFQALLKDIIQWQGLEKQFAVVFYDDQGQDVIGVLLSLLQVSS